MTELATSAFWKARARSLDRDLTIRYARSTEALEQQSHSSLDRCTIVNLRRVRDSGLLSANEPDK